MAAGVGQRHASLLKDTTRTRSTKKLFFILWGYLKPFKWTLILVSIIIFFYTLASTAMPIIIQHGLDALTGGKINQHILLEVILLFLIISILMWVLNSLSTRLMAVVTAKLIHDIREDTFNHLISADMKYHRTQESGNITSRVINDVEEITNGINVFTNVSTEILLIITTFFVLFYTNILFAIISLMAVPVAFAIVSLISSLGKTRMLQVRRAYGETSGKLAEALAGVTISKSFSREDETSGAIRKLNFQAYNYLKQLGMVFFLVMPLINMISILLVALILMAGGYILSTSYITVGTIYLAVVLVQRFLNPLVQLGNNFTQLIASLAAVDRIADVLEAKPAVHDAPDALPLDISDTSITFDNVLFSYNKNQPVLKHISLTINAGEKVALVGHTGAGKSTITSLIMRFYDPDEGTILIGKQALKNITLKSLHDTISLVPQEPYLFADTVLENIRYGRPNATDKEIYDLCKLLGADLFIEALPNGYQTVLQESGKSLSAGHRQMFTIARTMLTDPKIVILDEATSRLDAYSESLVQIAQNMLFRGRTTLVIAHRLSTIRDVNRIIVIDNGEIIEFGTHDELMQLKGKYYQLYRTYYMHQGIGSIDDLLEQEDKEKETLLLSPQATKS